MLTIYVWGRKETIITVDGTDAQVYPAFVQDGEKLIYLQERLDFAGVQDAEIFYLKRFLRLWIFSLKLTTKIRTSIIEFLHRYHAKQDLSFDCYSFACHVAGIERAHEKKELQNFWEIRARRWLPKVGDIIFLVSDNQRHFHHAAVYIGFGLYLSVWGAGGDLEIATLKDMKRSYKAEESVRVVPCIQRPV